MVRGWVNYSKLTDEQKKAKSDYLEKIKYTPKTKKEPAKYEYKPEKL